ncbi:MAG: energy-coupling factor transporter ATPase [Sporolactobacillus sp.]
MTALIQIHDLKFQYLHQENQKDWILNGINLQINQGEFLAILGPNGCGKSTLGKHLNALLLPSSGEVLIDGMNTRHEEQKLAIRQRVGMIFQNPDNQIISTIVEEDVAFAPENLGLDREKIRERVDAALQSVDMYAYRHQSPFNLSGGQKQRVAIAGILAMQPECLVLDEPTSMLDPEGRREVMKTLHQLNHELGITIILITHFMEEAAAAQRLLILDQGQIALEGSPADVFSHSELLRALHLDVPQVTELTRRLREKGIALPASIVNVEQCVQALRSALEDKNGTD